MHKVMHWMSQPWMTSQMSRPQNIRIVLRIRMVMRVLSVLPLNQIKK